MNYQIIRENEYEATVWWHYATLEAARKELDSLNELPHDGWFYWIKEV